MSYQSCVMKLVDNYFKFTLRNEILEKLVICKARVMLSIIILTKYFKAQSTCNYLTEIPYLE